MKYVFPFSGGNLLGAKIRQTFSEKAGGFFLCSRMGYVHI
jgi:hypothetical protein